MNTQEIIDWLEAHGSEQTRKVYRRHGARDPFYGVKISDLKQILKTHRNNHQLAIELWETGNSDAMYLAALMANKDKTSPQLLRSWMDTAYWYMLSESAVAALAAESPYGWDLGLEWIEAKDEMVAAGGWAALSSWISLRNNDQLDIKIICAHIEHISSHIHTAANRVRYGMNNYIICIGGYIPELYERILETARAIGAVTVDMGGTSCKTPFAPAYIEKIFKMGRIGKKRTHARC